MMMSVEQFIENTNKAATADEIFTIYKKALEQYGYDGICYCLVTDHPTLQLKANHGVMQNYPDEWVKHYSENNYKSIDPVLQLCFKVSKIFPWDILQRTRELANDEKKLMNEASEAKLLNGLALPIHGFNGELAAIGLASSSGRSEMHKDALDTIRFISLQFHTVYTEKTSGMTELERLSFIQSQRNVSLTEREREILLWISEGKSDQVIADILGISYPTVRFHLNNIFLKLDANERTLAVVKAIRHGHILPTYLKRM